MIVWDSVPPCRALRAQSNRFSESDGALPNFRPRTDIRINRCGVHIAAGICPWEMLVLQRSRRNVEARRRIVGALDDGLSVLLSGIGHDAIPIAIMTSVGQVVETPPVDRVVGSWCPVRIYGHPRFEKENQTPLKRRNRDTCDCKDWLHRGDTCWHAGHAAPPWRRPSLYSQARRPTILKRAGFEFSSIPLPQSLSGQKRLGGFLGDDQ